MPRFAKFLRSSADRPYAPLLVGALLVLFVATGCDSDDDDDVNQEPTVAQLVNGTRGLGTLSGALRGFGLLETLNQQEATFTLFAPINAAFPPYADYLNNDQDFLESVLEYHVVEGEALTAADLSDGDAFTTLQGDTLEVSVEDDTLFVGGAQVIGSQEASNGVVHVVDDLLLSNRSAVERVSATNNFSILEELVGQAGLAEVLAGPGPDGEDGLTVFAPTDDAFLAALDANGNDAIDDDEVPENAGDILSYHVVDDVYPAADVPETQAMLPTLEGAEVTVVRDGAAVTVNPGGDDEASVVTPNLEVSNGVIHGIDAVLMPPSN